MKQILFKALTTYEIFIVKQYEEACRQHTLSRI